MISKEFTPPEKDKILRDAFKKLKVRGIGSAWSESQQPFTDLQLECAELMNDPGFREGLVSYLRVHTTLPRSVEMLFTCISMAARARWQDVPDEMKTITARGWFLGRWIPTFLIIDGPFGRFMSGEDSPLRTCFGTKFPILTAAKDFLAERTFKLLRNGFAHWGFDWHGTHFEFKNLRIVFSRSGDVVWYSSFLDDCSSYKGKESCMDNVFVTGVLEKRDGRWVHVLMHGSYPVDKIPENYIRKFYSNLFDKKE